MKGAHTIAFGGVIRLICNNRASTRHSFSDALANSSYLPGTGAEFLAPDAPNTLVYKRQFTNLLGILTQLTAPGNYDLQGNLLPEGTTIKRNFVDQEYEMYVQDTWKATRSLTITAGLRVTLAPPIMKRRATRPAPPMSLEDWYNLRGRSGGARQAAVARSAISFDLASITGRGLYPFQHDFAPRLALAYSPDGASGLSKFFFGGPGKSAIRAGFGMYYDLFGQSIIRQLRRDRAWVLQFLHESRRMPAPRPSPGSRIFSSAVWFLGVSHSGRQEHLPAGLPAMSSPSQNSLDDKIKSPYTMNMDFSIQREFGHGFLVQAAYVGRLSRRSLIKDDLAMPTNLVDSKSGRPTVRLLVC